MSAQDAAIGAKVLVGQNNWKDASYLLKWRAVLFGRLELVTHLGLHGRIRWLGDDPYLIRVREVRA